MPSEALQQLLAGLVEIDNLQKANPSPQEGSGLRRPDVVRAIGRSEVVLLSSHFERFIYALTEEAVGHLCASGRPASDLPERMRLEHAKLVIDDLASTGWERRATKLKKYSSEESWLWTDSAAIQSLDHERLLAWMKAPTPKSLIRAFKLWNIEDIFSAITKKKTHRQRFFLQIDELVEKRNSIAHGDLTAQATYLDVVRYRKSVREFAERTDRIMARQLLTIIGTRPW